VLGGSLPLRAIVTIVDLVIRYQAGIQMCPATIPTPHFKFHTRVYLVLYETHAGIGGGHFLGDVTTRKVFQAGLWWSIVIKDAWKFAKECDSCQCIGQPFMHDKMTLNLVTPLEPFQKWAMDFVGPFRSSSRVKYKYILVVAYYYIKLVEARALRDNKATLVVKFLYEHIITRFDCPIEIISDRGGHFINVVVKELMERHLIIHKKLKNNYPQANG